MRGESIGQNGPDTANASDDLLALLAAVDDWVFVVDEDGHVLHASEVAQRHSGAAVLGGAVFASIWRDQQRPQLAAAWSAIKAAGSGTERLLLETCAAPTARIDLRLKLGRFRGKPAIFGIGRELGHVAQDETFRRSVEASSNVAQKYEALFGSSMFAMGIFDARGRCIEANAALERLNGLSSAEAYGKDGKDIGIISPELQQSISHQLDIDGSPQFATLEFKRRDGETRIAMHSTSRALVEGVPLSFAVAYDITDFLRLQRALRDQDQQFRALFDNVKDGMFFVDPEGRFYEVNAAACEQLGYTREELLQMSVVQIARPGFEFSEVIRRFDSIDHASYETINRRKDGTIVPIELTLTRLQRGGSTAFACIARDLTTRKRIQNELRDARDRLHATLQALPDLVFEFDADGAIQEFFSSRPHLLTMPPSEFIGRKVSELATPDVAYLLMAAVHEALETGLSVGTQYRVRGDRWMELSAARRADVPHDERPRVIAIAREITERKLREQELERKNDELMRFTYTVSHDLKSPLVTIKSFVGYLVDDLANDRQDRVKSDIGYIQKAADRMDQLLDDLLELSRIGRKVNPPERLSLRTLCEEACEMIAGRITSLGAEVVMPELAVTLWGDRVRLLEVLQNLLDNALKFSQASPPVRVFIEVAKPEHEYVVSVRDRGIGIDPRHQHKLFGLFEKLHPGAEGTGIGLALVKRIIEVHGGRVWIESAGEGHGTTVSFSLPETKLEGES